VLDEACFYAANSLFDDVWLTTASLSTDYTGAIDIADTLHVHARVLHAGRSSVIVEGIVWINADTIVARGNGTFVKTKLRLPDSPESS
jgi:acyl-coenzyme A thioesterase PaaI-like protein